MKWKSNCCGATIIYGEYNADLKQEIGMCNTCKEHCGSYDEDANEDVIDQETQLPYGNRKIHNGVCSVTDGADTKPSEPRAAAAR